MKRSYSIGIDLGGTQLRVGIIDAQSGDFVSSIVSMPSEIGAARGNGSQVGSEQRQVLQSITQSVRTALHAAHLSAESVVGVGVAVPDPVMPNGTLGQGCTTLIGWDGFDVLGELKQHLSQVGISTVWAGNDVNAHAIGELRFGVGRNDQIRDFVYFAIGTGVGAGLILNGRLRVGSSGFAGEWGHIVVDPLAADPDVCWGCGRQRGCLEVLGSGTAIAYHAGRAVDSDADSVAALRAYVQQEAPRANGQIKPSSAYVTAQGRVIDTRMLVALASSDNGQAAKQARGFITAAGTALGKALVQVMHSINPELIVVGGSVLAAGDLYLLPARSWVETHALPGAIAEVRVSDIREEAAILGAAASVVGTPVGIA